MNINKIRRNSKVSEFQRLQQTFFLFLTGIEVLGILQKEPADCFQESLASIMAPYFTQLESSHISRDILVTSIFPLTPHFSKSDR